MLFVGNDWSVGHHDVCLMNKTGEWLAARRLGEGPEGWASSMRWYLSESTIPHRVVVGVETDRGLWIEALVAAGYRVVLRSTPARWPGTGNDTACRVPSLIAETPSCWLIWFALTGITTVR